MQKEKDTGRDCFSKVEGEITTTKELEVEVEMTRYLNIIYPIIIEIFLNSKPKSNQSTNYILSIAFNRVQFNQNIEQENKLQ